MMVQVLEHVVGMVQALMKKVNESQALVNLIHSLF